MTHPTNPNAVKVKRDGERGWHWVANFDPAVHELFDVAAPLEGDEAGDKPARKPKGGRNAG